MCVQHTDYDLKLYVIADEYCKYCSYVVYRVQNYVYVLTLGNAEMSIYTLEQMHMLTKHKYTIAS